MICPVSGKHCHTRAEARAHIRTLLRSTFQFARLSSYRCPHWRLHRDAMFHVGHLPVRRRR